MFASAQNLITNPGFESWEPAAGATPAKPTGWSFVSATGISQETDASLVHSGSSSLKNVAPATGNSSCNIDVAAEANTQYSLGYWVLDNDANARLRHWVQARTASGNVTWNNTTFQPTTYTTDSPQWVFVNVTSTTPATTSILRVDFRNYGTGAGAGSVYVDDVVLVKGILAVTDVKEFDKAVQFNTVVKDQITFKLPTKATVNVYSTDGKLVSSNRVDNGGSINTQSLVKGAYIVTVDDGSAKISRKVIKN